jgi:hypothetical protein
MEFRVSIGPKDEVQALLYQASTSELIRKKRKRNKTRMPLIFLALGLIPSFLFHDFTLFLLYLPLGLLWYYIYPLIEKNQYPKHYLRHTEEKYRERGLQHVDVKIDTEKIVFTDQHSEGEIKLTGIKKVAKVPDYYFIITIDRQYIVLPEKYVPDPKKLESLFNYASVPVTDETYWKWK